MFTRRLYAKVDLRVTTGKEFTGLVGDIDFGVKSAAGEVDGVGGSNDFAVEATAGILHELERRGDPRFDIRCVDFGDADEGANRIGLGEVEECLTGAAIAGVDEVSRIDVALRENAAERRVDVLERFEFFEAADVRFGSSGGRFLCCVIANGVVNFLFRNAIGLDQFLKAIRGDLREILVGFRGAEISSGLQKLLIDFGRVNVGEQFAFLYARADVVIPTNEIAVGARVNRRLNVSLRRGGQNQVFLAGGDGRVNDLHVGDGHFFGCVGEGLELRTAGQEREAADDDQNKGDKPEYEKEMALFLGLLIRRMRAVFLVVMRSSFCRGHSLLRFASAMNINAGTSGRSIPKFFRSLLFRPKWAEGRDSRTRSSCGRR